MTVSAVHCCRGGLGCHPHSLVGRQGREDRGPSHPLPNHGPPVWQRSGGHDLHPQQKVRRRLPDRVRPQGPDRDGEVVLRRQRGGHRPREIQQKHFGQRQCQRPLQLFDQAQNVGLQPASGPRICKLEYHYSTLCKVRILLIQYTLHQRLLSALPPLHHLLLTAIMKIWLIWCINYEHYWSQNILEREDILSAITKKTHRVRRLLFSANLTVDLVFLCK